jgi:peroxiredoxin (alkyl hydroperoxide reductase subunit C)
LGKIQIPLLSDLTHQISKDYGVYLQDVGHALRYKSNKNGFSFDLFVFVFRGLFIIDGRGILRQITMNDLPVGRSTDETIRLLQAFQYTDKHEEGKV